MRRWYRSLLGVFTAAGFLVVSLLSRLPAVRDELAASTSQVGLLVLGVSSGAVTGLLLAGCVVARLGATRTVAAFAVVAAAGVAGAGAVVT
ncbi:hypothetical protein [Quadrisphaera sp. DSM 44207]|uniref:hypothetical protein n=1 Tax=Quadrisphaera sp. DSM 44207 TaxID=1881057 RepID=UPI00088235B6|nr:hypothetical protein [Quadrisphaera sp. DSM 44207]SDQ21410.1 hypothetical protein SAMN05428996_1116 [Quadrisphaera sp. DSM 44207]